MFVFAVEHVVGAFPSSFAQLPNIINNNAIAIVSLALFSFFHAIYLLGWKNAIKFFGLSAVISWAYEQVGVATGLIYGHYHYTQSLGIKIGYVPILIPLAWFMMIYPSYVIANYIVCGQPISNRSGVRKIAWVSILGAVVITAWDLVIDPIYSNATNRPWVWEQQGLYFGVPLHNYAGWLLTTFTIYFIYKMVEDGTFPHPIGAIKKAFVALPLLAYGLNILNGSAEFMLIGLFAMGFPLLIATTRMWNQPNYKANSGKDTS